MEVLVFWLFLAGLVGFFGSSRGRDGVVWFLLSAVLSPLLGFIILLVIPNLKKEEEAALLKRREEARREEERAQDHERQIEALKALRRPSDATGAATSVADEIEKLGALRERGLLTDDEFKAQKATLLTRA